MWAGVSGFNPLIVSTNHTGLGSNPGEVQVLVILWRPNRLRAGIEREGDPRGEVSAWRKLGFEDRGGLQRV